MKYNGYPNLSFDRMLKDKKKRSPESVRIGIYYITYNKVISIAQLQDIDMSM